jgi:ribosomal protein L37E
MSAIYCSSCGVKHTYSYAKPKFCSSCGSPMSVEIKKPQPQRQVEEEEYDDDDDPDSSNSSYVPQINKLQVDVENYSENSSFSLGALFGQKTEPSTRRRRSRSVDDFISEKPRSGEE